MANQEQYDILKQGVETWNQWREEHEEYADIQLDLSEVDLSGENLEGANFDEVNLSGANLSGASLEGANLDFADLNGANLSETSFSPSSLSRANLSGADLSKADLSSANLASTNFNKANLSRADFSAAYLVGANLSRADLSRACLVGANLTNANFTDAILAGADLSRAILVGANLTKANLTDCKIYGISVWDIQLQETIQSNLIITQNNQSTITVDNLKIAQFVYLLLNNAEIRDVIDTIAKKAVLILGRFTPERKAILDAIRDMLRQKGYLPILFDFDRPQSKDLTGTVSTLAHLAKFVIVDLTSPSSAPHEVMAIAPHCIVPIQPLFHPDDITKHEYAMFRDLQRRYHWVLPTHHYQHLEDLLASLQTKVIAPAEQKALELEER